MDRGIQCINAYKNFGVFQMEDVSFEMPGGYILGVIGRNGCGKTTLLRTLMGLYRMEDDKSDILIDGISVMKDIRNYKGSIAWVLNETPFITSPLKIGELYGRYYPGFSMKKYLSLLSAYGIRDTKLAFSFLSAGEMIKVQLAFALSYDAKLYIFDEPTGNLDPEFRDEFYSVIRNIVSTGEKTVIYATHLLEELDGFADYILWMQRKENVSGVRYFGTSDELKEQYRMIEGIDSEEELLPKMCGKAVIAGGRRRENHSEYLVRLIGGNIPDELENNTRYADLKEIMYYEEKGGIV